MKTRMYVTLCVPVDVEAEENVPLTQTAIDEAWERISQPDGPPEGLVEVATTEQPIGLFFDEAAHVEGTTQLLKAA